MLNLLLLLTTTFHSFALEVDSQHCSEEQQAFIRANTTLKDAKLDLNYNEINNLLTGSEKVCALINPHMSDGLSYRLYLSKDNKLHYVRIHNGLDGSYQMYGPFKQKLR